MGIITAVVLPSLAAACPVRQDGDTLIASPADTAQASALLRAAAEHDLTIVPRGAGTGWAWRRANPAASTAGPPLAGPMGDPPAGAAGDAGDGAAGGPSGRVASVLVVDTCTMDKVVEHVAGDLVATVQAGVTIGRLAEALGAAGQRLALDAPPEVTVGGMLATGLAGPLRFRYGSPRDLLIGITIVRPDGVIAHSGGKVVKNVAGYDLGKLFTGSHGTLGLITEATFRLHPIPQSVAYLTASSGPSQDPAAVASVVAAAANSPLQPSAIELNVSDGIATIGVLLEGTTSGVADRAKAMTELLGSIADAPRSTGTRSPADTLGSTDTPGPASPPGSTGTIGSTAGALDSATGALGSADTPRSADPLGSTADAPRSASPLKSPGTLGSTSAPGSASALGSPTDMLGPAAGALAGGALGSVEVSDTPPPWWGRLPEPIARGVWRDDIPPAGESRGEPPESTVVRVTFWLRSLADVLAAIASSGIPCTVRGSAGAGTLYICAEDGTEVGGLVAALRSVVADRGVVVVLTDPPEFGNKLMRAVKDQFDPGHRMTGQF